MKEAELPSTFEVGHRNPFSYSHHLHCPRDLFIIIISSLSFFIFFVIAEVLQSRLHWRGCARRPPLQKDLPSLVRINFSVIISNSNIPSLCFHCVPFISHPNHEDAQESRYQVPWTLQIETIRQCIAMTGQTESEIDCVCYLPNKQWIEKLRNGH